MVPGVFLVAGGAINFLLLFIHNRLRLLRLLYKYNFVGKSALPQLKCRIIIFCFSLQQAFLLLLHRHLLVF